MVGSKFLLTSYFGGVEIVAVVALILHGCVDAVIRQVRYRHVGTSGEDVGSAG